MTSYQNIFTSGVISPAIDSYVSYTLTGTLHVVWPQETAPNSNLAAQIIEISVATAGSFAVQLPPANMVSVGQFLLFNNLSAFNQAIYDNSGSTIIAAIAPGAIYFLYVRDNSTAAGVWGAFQYGAQASAPNAAALAGPGLIAIGATLGQDIVVLNLTSNYAAGINDRVKLLNWTGGSGTITLPLAASVGASYYIQARNSGTSTLTVAASGSDTINGATTVTFGPGDSAFIVTDGTSWYTIGFGTSQTNAFPFIAINVPAVVSGGIVTLSGTQLNQIAYRFFGALTTNTIVDLPAYAQQYWVDNETTGPYTLTFQVPTAPGGPTPAGATVVVPQGARAILYTDGSNVLDASTGGLSVPISVSQGGTGATTAPTALTNLGGTTVGAAVFTAASQAAAQTAIGSPSTADAVVLAMAF